MSLEVSEIFDAIACNAIVNRFTSVLPQKMIKKSYFLPILLRCLASDVQV